MTIQLARQRSQLPGAVPCRLPGGLMATGSHENHRKGKYDQEHKAAQGAAEELPPKRQEQSDSNHCWAGIIQDYPRRTKWSHEQPHPNGNDSCRE